MNKKELQEKLDVKPVASAVVPGIMDGTVHPKWGKLGPFQLAYLRQNPAKFEEKMKKGQVPAEALSSPINKPINT